MSISSSRIANLDRLCQELETHAQSLGIPMGPSPVAEKLSQSLFLAHSTADQKFAQVCAARCLSSNAKLAAEQGITLAADCTEVVLGTSDTVFFYAAPFRYPNTGCGLLYARSLEKDYESTGAATPFDSGGLRHKMVRPDPAEPVQTFLARHELPIPGHRRYLGHVMTALFEKTGRLCLGPGSAAAESVGVYGRRRAPLDPRSTHPPPGSRAPERSPTGRLRPSGARGGRSRH